MEIVRTNKPVILKLYLLFTVISMIHDKMNTMNSDSFTIKSSSSENKGSPKSFIRTINLLHYVNTSMYACTDISVWVND